MVIGCRGDTEGTICYLGKGKTGLVGLNPWVN